MFKLLCRFEQNRKNIKYQVQLINTSKSNGQELHKKIFTDQHRLAKKNFYKQQKHNPITCYMYVLLKIGERVSNSQKLLKVCSQGL